jgi:hypothetical protein
VNIEPEPPKGSHRAVIKRAVEMYGRDKLLDALPAYDGQRSLYTARKLPETVEMVDIQLDEGGAPRK